MEKNKEFTSLLGEVPALTHDAEGQLRGGFAVLAPQIDARDTSRDNNICSNNKICVGNDVCANNDTCTGSWKPGTEVNPGKPTLQ